MSDHDIDPGSWGEGYRAGYAQALADARARLLDVAEWCERNGFASRARLTRSNASRIVQDDDTTAPAAKGGNGHE